MEIRIKELLEEDDEDILLNKTTIRESILRIPYFNVMLYKILSQGDIEQHKQEIQIVTPFGNYYCNYTKSVHEYLKDCIKKIEEDMDRDLKD
jgi:hypothetical protein